LRAHKTSKLNNQNNKNNAKEHQSQQGQWKRVQNNQWHQIKRAIASYPARNQKNNNKIQINKKKANLKIPEITIPIKAIKSRQATPS